MNWSACSQTNSSTVTPRYEALVIASSSDSSGTKYGLVSDSVCWARWTSSVNSRRFGMVG